MREHLAMVSRSARELGLTHPLHTTFQIAADSQEPALAPGGRGSDEGALVGPGADPFDKRVLDSRMVTHLGLTEEQIVEELSTGDHLLVLNKYNTMKDHALVITREFRSQDEALSESDFRAWFEVVEALPGAGFFNSGAEAGASQPHKHMQVIPEDVIWGYRPGSAMALPVDEAIATEVGGSRDLDKVWRVPCFMFPHALTLLPTPSELRWDRRQGGGGSNPTPSAQAPAPALGFYGE
ncbi:unnamed protein product [Discosporangium mesarthrocarpum]